MIEAQFKIWQIEHTEANQNIAKANQDIAELIKKLHASEQEVRRLKAENDRLKVRIFDLTEGKND